MANSRRLYIASSPTGSASGLAEDRRGERIAAGGAGRVLRLPRPQRRGQIDTIRMLCGLLQPDAGRIEIAGIDLMADPLAVKRCIGVLPEETNLYERLTGEEFLVFSGQMYGLSRDETQARAESLLALMELAEDRKKLIVDYSMGMRKKVALAAAMITGRRSCSSTNRSTASTLSPSAPFGM